MIPDDPLLRFERLAAVPAPPAPPVHVAPKVMRRISRTENASLRTLELLTAGCCAAAVIALLLGVEQLTWLENPLQIVMDLVPPIEL